MRLLLVAGLLLTLTCAAQADVVKDVLGCSGDPCVVYHNPGGDAGTYIRVAKAINKGARHKVIFRGKCMSACTLIADRVKNACAESTASFGFHLGRRLVAEQTFYVGTGTVTKQYFRTEDPSWLYSKKVLKWVKQHGGFTTTFKMMPARAAWRFWVKPCR